MKAKIVYEESMFLIGMGFYGDPFSTHSGWDEENEIGRLWSRFSTFLEKNPEKIKNRVKEDVALEIFFTTEETMSTGMFEVFVGVIVDKIEKIPLQCVLKQLPAGNYAVFTLKGNEITADWQHQIYDITLPELGYESSCNYNIQYYDQRFKGLDNIEESELDVYIPVKKITG
ncbi:MAG: GyrI-like domain-containing protein [Halanaerobiales bacterium]